MGSARPDCYPWISLDTGSEYLYCFMVLASASFDEIGCGDVVVVSCARVSRL
jgi:hypothetical protein